MIVALQVKHIHTSIWVRRLLDQVNLSVYMDPLGETCDDLPSSGFHAKMVDEWNMVPPKMKKMKKIGWDTVGPI